MTKERLLKILYNAIIAYESELDNQDYESEEELHDVLLNEFEITDDEYEKILQYNRVRSIDELNSKKDEILSELNELNEKFNSGEWDSTIGTYTEITDKLEGQYELLCWILGKQK